jgi:hypothetical protein
MATTYATPGVYIEEVDKGSKPIEVAGASTAAFVGITAEASMKAVNEAGDLVPVESVLNRPILVTNWTQYQNVFGGFIQGAFTPDAVYGYFNNGGGPAYVTSIRAIKEATEGAVAASTVVTTSSGKGDSFKVASKVPGASGNDLVVNINNDDEKGNTFTMTVGDQSISGLEMKKTGNYVGDAQFDAVAISDVGTTSPGEGKYELSGGGMPPVTAAEFIGDVVQRSGLAGLEVLDDARLILCPDLMAGYDGSDDFNDKIKAVQTAMIADCERLRYRFAILDTPPGLNAQQAKEWRLWVNYDSSYAAMYYPWVSVADLSDSPKTTKMMPPSGHVVGVYNRVDGTVGVHKAPANEIVAGALDVEMQLTKGEQGVLNPIGVNCIRSFPGRGIRVWGARTLSSDGSWRYINVRRLFIVVGASLDTGLQWVVFEPNDHTLWAKVRRDINAFMSNIWLSGALFGTSKGDAFYVRCDEELNPTAVRDLGQLIIEIGMAPVKPAEFVIVRLSQWAGPNAE